MNSQSSSQTINDVTEYTKTLLGAVAGTVKASSSLPHSGDDYDLYSSFHGFRNFYTQQASRVTECLNSFLKHQGMRLLPSKVSIMGDVEDRYDRVVEANDMMLEKVAAQLERASNPEQKMSLEPEQVIAVEGDQTTQQQPKPIISSWNREKKRGKSQMFRLFHAQNIARPQTRFKDKIDNANVPFVPKIKQKPNALKPLPEALLSLNSRPQDGDVSLAIANLVRQGREYTSEDQNIYAHPYETELNALRFTEEQLQRVEPRIYSPFPSEPCEVITAKADLMSVVEHLKSCAEFAVDLEAHSYRTFQGITCLMQISSRKKDFLVDTLELRSEIHRFNEVFTDPRIVKVFHGADFDVQWLQRDFGVYVVNMFDTGQAARALGLRHFSLDYLLQRYCSIHADKKYQLADWRIRPIPEEMRRYAQEDTHYLLYIYDVMKNELLACDDGETELLNTPRLLHVLNKSKSICLKKYEKFLLHPNSHMQLYEKWKSKKRMNDKQLELFRLLYVWRDAMARQEDESTGYVLPKHMLFQIADIMPRETQGILACCNPVPPLVHQHVHAIHQLVIDARTKSFSKKNDPSVAVSQIKTPVPAKPEIQEYENFLTCPHDTSHIQSGSARNSKILVRRVESTAWSSFLSDEMFSNSRKHVRESEAVHWDPFIKYFNTASAAENPRYLRSPEKVVSSVDDLNLKTMLSPEYAWKLRNLKNAGIQDEPGQKKDIKQPDIKEEVIILSKLPQMHGQKRQSSTQPEKKKPKHGKKAKKVAENTNFQPFNYKHSHYNRFKK